VNALDEATQTSVQALVNIQESVILDIVDHTTLTIQKVNHHLFFTSFKHSIVSAVSHD
jgi:hypothetical protein